MKENIESKDRALFDTIASAYARKDEVESSRLARQFQLHSLMDIVSEIKPNYGQVLEIGCGVGASAEYIAGRFENYLGTDYSENLIGIANARYASKNVRFECVNAKDIDVSQKFDVIFGVGVLHHVDDCSEVLDTIKKFMHSDSVVAFVEPQRGNPFVQLLRAVRKKTDAAYSDDQRFFSRSELVQLFERADFSVYSVKYQGYFSPPLAQVIMNPQSIFKMISRITIGLDKFVQKYLNNRLSWNIVIVARLKPDNEKIS